MSPTFQSAGRWVGKEEGYLLGAEEVDKVTSVSLLPPVPPPACVYNNVWPLRACRCPQAFLPLPWLETGSLYGWRGGFVCLPHMGQGCASCTLVASLCPHALMSLRFGSFLHLSKNSVA